MPAGPSPSSDPFDATLREHADAARRLARHLVFDRDRADDVAQEAMRVALMRPAAEGRSSMPWLRGIVRNVARAFLRREGRRPEVEARAFADREARRSKTALDDPAALVARAEEHRRAVDAVLRLAEPYRAALILRFLEDLEPSEVARRQGVPLETARTRIRRGLDLVRAELDAHHGGDRRAWMGLLGPISVLPSPVVPTPAPPPAHVPAPVPVPALAGVIAVKKLAAVALVLLLAGGAWRLFFVPAGEGGGMSRAAGPEVSTLEVATGDATLAGRGRPASAADALPPPVALDAPDVIDRDRDIHGVVVHEDGTPVAGADVSAVVRPWIGAVLIGSPAKDEERVLASTRTAIDGTFALRLERGTAATLRVVATGLASFAEESVGAGDRLRVVLHPGVRLLVVVKDAGGSAVANATVRLARMSGPTSWGYVREGFRREGATDVAGRIAFGDLPAGSGGTWTVLTVNLPAVGQAHWGTVEVPAQGEAMHEVVLATAKTCRGRVTDAITKKPIVGAIVGIGREQQPRVTTGADGRYAIVFPPTNDPVYAEADGHAWTGAYDVRDEGTVDFALARAATIRGRLVDAAGPPIAAATLTAHGTWSRGSESGRGEATSAADGHFELKGLSPASTSELWVAAPGFGRRVFAIDAIGEAGARDLGDIVLGAGRSVEGRVVDRSGKPVAGVHIDLRGPTQEAARFWIGVARAPGEFQDERVTDDLGRFRFADVAPGDYRLVAQARGQEKQEQAVVLREDDVVGLVFTLRAGRTLSVEVRGPDGKPLSWTSVEIRFADGSRHAEEAHGTSEVEFTVPDEDVSIQLVGVQPGQSPPPPELVRKGTEHVVITALPGDVPWRIDGVVIGPDGAPLALADVRVTSGGAVGASGLRTDERGRFVHGVAGVDRVTFTLDGTIGDSVASGTVDGAFEADPVEITRGTRDVVIRTRRVPAGQTLRVKVEDPDGRPLLDVPVELNRPNGNSCRPPTAAGADGYVEFKDLVGRPLEVWRGGGSYKLGGTWVSPFLEVVPSGQTVVYRFVAGTTVRGVLLGPDGMPFPRTYVFANAGQRGPSPSAASGTDGTFAIAIDAKRHLPLTLTVSVGSAYPPSLVGRAEFTVLPTEPVTIRLAPPPPAAK